MHVYRVTHAWRTDGDEGFEFYPATTRPLAKFFIREDRAMFDETEPPDFHYWQIRRLDLRCADERDAWVAAWFTFANLGHPAVPSGREARVWLGIGKLIASDFCGERGAWRTPAWLGPKQRPARRPHSLFVRETPDSGSFDGGLCFEPLFYSDDAGASALRPDLPEELRVWLLAWYEDLSCNQLWQDAIAAGLVKLDPIPGRPIVGRAA